MKIPSVTVASYSAYHDTIFCLIHLLKHHPSTCIKESSKSHDIINGDPASAMSFGQVDYNVSTISSFTSQGYGRYNLLCGLRPKAERSIISPVSQSRMASLSPMSGAEYEGISASRHRSGRHRQHRRSACQHQSPPFSVSSPAPPISMFIAATAYQRVIAVAAHQRVIAGTAGQGVSAAHALEDVGVAHHRSASLSGKNRSGSRYCAACRRLRRWHSGLSSV